MKSIFIAAVTCLTLSAFSAVTITTPPSITGGNGNYQISFAVSEYCDVEVAVVKLTDSSVVRHLGAAVLGANPPLPFTPNALSQTLTWDGKDDRGNAVTTPLTGLSVRVRAGMQVSYEQAIGGNPYAFNPQFGVNGVFISQNGQLYAYGRTGINEFTSLRLYNKDGVYNKTLFPYPSSLTASKKTPYGVVDFLGRTMPRVQRLYGPMITTTIAASDISKLAEIDDPDGCWIFQGTENKMMMIGNDGGAKSTPVVPMVTSPRYPDHYKTGGSPHLTLSPDGKYLYYSGFFESVNSNNNDPITADTGFWRDGRVFRINAATGAATAFITMDSIPKTGAARSTIIGGGGRQFAAFAGLDFDAAGNIFVCDRLHGRVSVYDTSANLLGYVNVKYPEAVKVDRKSGVFYVLRWVSTGYHAGDAVLFKFATYQGSPQPVCSLRINGTGQGSFEGGSTFLALDNSGSSNILWCSDASIGIKRYVDNGNSFTLEQNWKTAHSADWGAGQYSTLGFDKIVVDRAKDIVYINNGNSGLCKVDNWKNPKVVPCSTSANRRLYAVDLAMSADNQLYIVEGPNYTGPITRWASKAGKLDSIPFPNTGKNMATHEIYGRMHGVGGYGPKGMAVSPDKKIAVQYMYQFSRYFIGVFGDSGSADNIERCDTVMKPTCPDNGVGGAIRYDSKGNLYMGVAFHAPGFPEISAYPSGDETYSRYTGSIARIPKGNKGSHTARNVTGITGHDKLYPIPLGAYSANCWCRLPTFDIDAYDRLCVPSAVTQEVRIADNNGNEIVKFGTYGNWDENGASFPMAFPTGVAATDDYIYVSDLVNGRLLRIKKNFAADNLPGFTTGADKKIAHTTSLTATIAPNPFTQAATITFNGLANTNATAAIYNAAGVKIKTLFAGIALNGALTLAWDGKNEAGNSAAEGVYFIKLVQGGKKLTSRILLTK